MHSVTWKVFIEHLLYAKKSARLWRYSCERDKVPASWDSLFGGGDEETVSMQRGKPSTVPAQPEVEGSFKRKELELGMGRGGGSVSGRGNRIRAQIVVLPLPSH